MTTSVSDAELAALLADLRPDPPAAAETRCTVTDLIASQCAHCRPAQPADVTTSGLGPWIAATYRGQCSGCGSRIEEFDRIRADGDRGWLAHCCGNVEDKGTGTPALATLLADLRPDPVTADPSCYRCSMGDPCSGNHETAEQVYGVGYERHLDQAFAQTAPAQIPAGPPPSTVAEMRDVLGALDASRPRSMQTALGPSELGTPCQRQIAMKLAGVPRQPEGKRPPWAPMQGTAMHVLMEEALRFHNAQLGRERWVVEERLEVDPGLHDTSGIFGHGDAFDTDWAMVVDWKYVGVTALREVKRKTIANHLLAKPEYRVQAHLYGLGHERAGREVRWVRLVFLARSHDYDDSAEWTERYDPAIAHRAVQRYYATHDLIGPNGLDLAANPALWPVTPSTPGKACDWCPFRRAGDQADGTGCPGNTETLIGKQLAGLIA